MSAPFVHWDWNSPGTFIVGASVGCALSGQIVGALAPGAGEPPPGDVEDVHPRGAHCDARWLREVLKEDVAELQRSFAKVLLVHRKEFYRFSRHLLDVHLPPDVEALRGPSFGIDRE